MTARGTRIARFYHHEYFWLALIVALNLTLHLTIINQTTNLMFDEKHYVVDARHIVYDHYSDRNEHPPLAKLMISAGIMTFGDTPWGWRIPSVLAGEVAIIAFYLICRAINLSRRGASIATLLFATETLTFIMSGVAMLDIFMVSFMMLGFAFYLRGNYPLSALAMVLSALCKLTGMFGLLAIGLHWLILRRNKPAQFAVPFGIATGGFKLVMWFFDHNIINNVLNAVTQMQSLTFDATQQAIASAPWQWVLTLEGMVFNRQPYWVGIISITVWALIIPIMSLMVWYAWRKRDQLAIFALSWFAATYLLWIPLDFISHRVTFLYYFLPAVGAIVLAIGKWLENLLAQGKRDNEQWLSRTMVGTFVVVHIALFALFTPPLNALTPLVRLWAG